MAQLRRDPPVGRWIVIDSDYTMTPTDFPKETIPPADVAHPSTLSRQRNRTPNGGGCASPVVAQVGL